MTSGPSRRVRTAALSVMLAAFALGAATAHAGTNPTFTHLMELLAARQRGEVSFRARTYSAGLTRPLVSSGVLRYRAPDHLEQRTVKPVRSELILDGQQLTVRRGGHTRRLDVRAYPDIAIYVDALRDTLGGRAAQLKRLFAVHFTGTLAHWRMTLRPLRANARVRRIRLTGTAANIRTIEILAPNGARTLMRIGPPPGT